MKETETVSRITNIRVEGSDKGGAMPTRTDVMVWGMVVVVMCMIAIDIVRTQL